MTTVKLDAVAAFLRGRGHYEAAGHVLQRFGDGASTPSDDPPPARRALLRHLPDDVVVLVLSHLSFAEAAQALGACSKRLLELRRSDHLNTIRGASSYRLNCGVVQALATRLRTVKWPRCTRPTWRRRLGQVLPPPHLAITWHTVSSNPDYINDPNDHDCEMGLEDNPALFDYLLVSEPPEIDWDSEARLELDWEGYVDRDVVWDCASRLGTYAEYALPFTFRCTGFQLGYGCCNRDEFTTWSFQARDPKDPSKWFVVDGAVAIFQKENETMQFALVEAFESDCFRIVNGRDNQCFHIMAFELYGSICAPWNPSSLLAADDRASESNVRELRHENRCVCNGRDGWVARTGLVGAAPG